MNSGSEGEGENRSRNAFQGGGGYAVRRPESISNWRDLILGETTERRGSDKRQPRAGRREWCQGGNRIFVADEWVIGK